MMYTNAARVPQDGGYAVWKNSYISLLFPRIKSMAGKLPSERIRLSLQCVEYIQQLFTQKTLGIGTILLDIAGTQNSVHTFFFFEVFLIGSQHIKRLREESKYFEDFIVKRHSDAKI